MCVIYVKVSCIIPTSVLFSVWSITGCFLWLQSIDHILTAIGVHSQWPVASGSTCGAPCHSRRTAACVRRRPCADRCDSVRWGLTAPTWRSSRAPTGGGRAVRGWCWPVHTAPSGLAGRPARHLAQRQRRAGEGANCRVGTVRETAALSL